MKIKCYKYQGAGNDFVIIDNRDGDIYLSQPQIKRFCDRRFGIGGDGLMLLGFSKSFDFSMKYYNADGFEGTMCGNGGRCLIAFAARMGIDKYNFEAIDGPHTGQIIKYSPLESTVELGLTDVFQIKDIPPDKYFLNTGSPHLVIFPENFSDTDVDKEGRYWRHHFIEGGTNVNFVKVLENGLFVRTFERGVEAETYACGTGISACAIAFDQRCKKDFFGNYIVNKVDEDIYEIKVEAPGGKLSVKYKYEGGTKYTNIRLTGPATFVYETTIEIQEL
jgi:diaminopimelate epimerase